MRGAGGIDGRGLKKYWAARKMRRSGDDEKADLLLAVERLL
jgi:hypothetical protein